MFIKYSEAKIVDVDIKLEKISKFNEEKNKSTKASETKKKSVKTEK